MRKRFLDLKETAKELKIPVEKVRKYVREGKLPVIELGPRTRRVPVAALIEFALKQQKAENR